MSTRGCIAFGHGKYEWEGRYHHFDSYPSGLGATLYKLYNGYFEKDVYVMHHILFTSHPAGWSTINEADFTKDIGYGSGLGPACYCHGDRHEGEQIVTPLNICQSDMEWLYVINDSYTGPEAGLMKVYSVGNNGLTLVATVDLDGEEPDWEAME